MHTTSNARTSRFFQPFCKHGMLWRLRLSVWRLFPSNKGRLILSIILLHWQLSPISIISFSNRLLTYWKKWSIITMNQTHFCQFSTQQVLIAKILRTVMFLEKMVMVFGRLLCGGMTVLVATNSQQLFTGSSAAYTSQFTFTLCRTLLFSFRYSRPKLSSSANITLRRQQQQFHESSINK